MRAGRRVRDHRLSGEEATGHGVPITCAGLRPERVRVLRLFELGKRRSRPRSPVETLSAECQVVRTGARVLRRGAGSSSCSPRGLLLRDEEGGRARQLVEGAPPQGAPVKKLMYTPPAAPASVPTLSHIRFFAKQKLVVLRNRGLIESEKIEDYNSPGNGYSALAKALTRADAEQSIPGNQASACRGRRRRRPFPAGVKWATCAPDRNPAAAWSPSSRVQCRRRPGAFSWPEHHRERRNAVIGKA